MKSLLLLLFLTGLVVPEKVEVGQKIVATVEKNDQNLFILWDHSPDLEVHELENNLFIWGKEGNYFVEAITIPLKTITVDGETFDVVTGKIQRYKKTIQIGSNDPDPNLPFEAPDFSVLILKEAKETGNLPSEQVAIFTSPKVLGWLRKNCIFRVWDDDYTSDQMKNVPPFLSIAYSKFKTNKLPWIAISNPKKGIGYSGPLPKDIDSTLTLLEKYK